MNRVLGSSIFDGTVAFVLLMWEHQDKTFYHQNSTKGLTELEKQNIPIYSIFN